MLNPYGTTQLFQSSSFMFFLLIQDDWNLFTEEWQPFNSSFCFCIQKADFLLLLMVCLLCQFSIFMIFNYNGTKSTKRCKVVSMIFFSHCFVYSLAVAVVRARSLSVYLGTMILTQCTGCHNYCRFFTKSFFLRKHWRRFSAFLFFFSLARSSHDC